MYREVSVLGSPSFVAIAFDLLPRFRFRMEVEDGNGVMRFWGFFGLFERFLQTKCFMAAGCPDQVELGVRSLGEDVVELVPEEYRGQLGGVWAPGSVACLVGDA